MNVDISEMTASDYDEVYTLWQETEGIGLSSADSREVIAAFLIRNPGLCFVARQHGRLVGAVICGHDGRRGVLSHLAVDCSARKEGIGRALVEHCLKGLAESGIERCHIYVFRNNLSGIAFWESIGFFKRPELELMSVDISI